MAENPMLDILLHALEAGDMALAERAVVDKASAGRITLDHIREVGALLYGEDAPDSIPQEARVLLGSLLSLAAQRHPSADRNLRFFVSLRLWLAIPKGRRELWRMNAEAARTALAFAPADLSKRIRVSLLGDLGASLAHLGAQREALNPLQEAVAIYRRLAEAEPAAFEQYVATTLNNLGTVLSALGEKAEAREAYGEALMVYRRLAEAEPAAFELYVAATLSNRGNVQRELGERAEARRALEEAVAIYRRLAGAKPAAFEYYVVTALSNLGIVLCESGERAEAREAYGEALTVYRRLAEAEPAAFEQYVAMTLNSLGIVLRELGERAEAREACEEALTIRRRLAEAEPAAFEQHVAMTLNNLGIVLGDLGERAGAWKAYKEALEIYRRLAEVEPTAFKPGVATTLNSLGTVLRELGERAKAREAHEEALEIHRRLAEAEPAAFEPGVAGTLNNLGNVLRDLGERAGAREAYGEALMVYRRLAEAEPAAFDPDVAMTLNNLGIVLNELGERAEAREACEEGLAICRRLAEAEPAAFEQHVAVTLNNLGSVRRDLGERAGAREAYEEALTIRRRLAEAEPAAFEPDVAGTLSNLGNVLRELGEQAKAREAYGEALRIYRWLAEAEPAAFEQYMATTLNNLGNVLRDLGERAGTREAYEEALAIRRRLAEAEPAAFDPDVAMTLNNLGIVLNELGERAEAREAHEEALRIRRRLAEAEPAAFEPDVAATLNNLGAVLRALGERAGAREAYEEARVSARSAEPSLRAGVTANLGVLRYEGGEKECGTELAREAVEMIERWLSDPRQAGVRFSFKGEIEYAYRLLLCDPQLRSDTGRAHRVIEALREGEFLAEIGSNQPVAVTDDCPVAVNDMALLSIQRTHDGTAFLLDFAGDLHFEADDASWARAAERLLEIVQVSDCTTDIAAAGKALWDTTPEWVQEVLNSPPSGGIALSLDPDTGLLPLELMTPTGAPEDFLCLKLEMPRAPGERLFRRCLERDVIDGAAEPRALVFGNPVHFPLSWFPLLSEAEREAKELALQLESRGFAPAIAGGMPCLGDHARKTEFLDGVAADPSIIHYAGHGATLSDEEYLVLAGGVRNHNAASQEPTVDSDMLAAFALQAQATPLTHSPFVFLSSCRTGRARAYGGAFRGLPITFLRLGAAAVVASVFPLSDAPAASFAAAFYGRLLAGETVGEAMLQARQEMHRAGISCLHWGRPVLYGNPHARLKLP